MLKRALCWLAVLPFAAVFAVGAILVSVSLYAIYFIVDAFYPLGAEWSA